MNSLSLILISIIYLVIHKVSANNYTYICLETHQNYCIGISPGDALPTSEDEFKLQIKNRLRNEDNMQAWKKTRFDISNDNGTIKMTNFDLYLAQKPRSGSVFLLEEPSIFNLTSFTSNFNKEGVIKLTDSDDCLTVMQCSELDNGQREFCNPNTNKEVRNADDLKTGAYLRFRPCQDSFSQIFRQKLDCADDCAPVNIGDGVCDLPCNNTMCNFDYGDCDFTISPTTSPTQLRVTLIPTESPTRYPTYSPTGIPTPEPTDSPTTFPTKGESPIPNPTATPLYKTETPTMEDEYEFEQELRSPTISPDEEDNDTALFAFLLTAGILLLLFFCCFGYWIAYLREEENDNTQEPVPQESQESQESFIGDPQIGYIHIQVDEDPPRYSIVDEEEKPVKYNTDNNEEIEFKPLPSLEEDEEKQDYHEYVLDGHN